MNCRIRLQNFLTPHRRRHLSKIWVAVTIFYDILRALVVAKAFAKYGVNAYLYLLFELLVSIFFAFSSLRLVLSMVDNDRKKTVKYMVYTTILFFAPDIYC